MNTYISVNIVSHALLLMHSIHHFACKTISDIYHLRLPIEVNRHDSLSFLSQIHWIHRNTTTLNITEKGFLVLSLFDGTGISQNLWKQILYDYITICSPIWAKRIPFGRQEAYLFMGDEEKRCFVYAGLIDSFDKDTIKWWDTLANMQRQQDNARLDITGRTGEHLTMIYEKERTEKNPEWCSIESNLSGYDIISCRDKTSNEKILIEVKCSFLPVSKASFHISKQEWSISQLSNNLDRYFFYLWSISEKSLAVLTPYLVKPHIPTNNNSGLWEEVEIPYSVFSGCFVKPPNIPFDVF